MSESHTPSPLEVREDRLLSIAVVCALLACGGPQTATKTASTTAGADSASAAGGRGGVIPSPHTVFVQAPNGVRLEVLDWGGKGEPLVFFAGLGNTGHVFDDFAPRFTDRYHVIAITRRGFGASDHPASGYSMADLESDVHAVLDSLHLSHVDLAGHSIAGQELTWVAGTHPGDVSRLIYLDQRSTITRIRFRGTCRRSHSRRPPIPLRSRPRSRWAHERSDPRIRVPRNGAAQPFGA